MEENSVFTTKPTTTNIPPTTRRTTTKIITTRTTTKKQTTTKMATFKPMTDYVGQYFPYRIEDIEQHFCSFVFEFQHAQVIFTLK